MVKTRKRRIALLLSVIFLISAVSLFCYARNEELTATEYRLCDGRIKSPIRLVMLSDLHGTFYGKDQGQIIKMIEKHQPHAVLLAGDFFDEDNPFDAAKCLIEGLTARYPCYFVSGNHEYTADFKKVRQFLESAGVICLWGENKILKIEGQQILLGGVYDKNHHSYHALPQKGDPEKVIKELKEERKKYGECYAILLCHRPDPTLFSDSGYDLILSGHNHGGQVSLPGIINGLYAPEQGFFPKYAAGRYTLNSQSTLIVGRGLAVNNVPRLFNPPEIVCVELLPAERS